jgi:glycosyltransferase involved in cell wall biosynthesis
MKILLTTDTVGGVWTYAIQLARALEPHGVHIALATMGAALSPAQRAQVSRLANVELHESTYKLEWMQQPWEDVRAAGEWLLEIEHQFQPDVVHLNGYVHARLPLRAPVLVVGHSCVLSWWDAVKCQWLPESWDRYRSEVAAGLRAADVVVAPSQAMLTALHRHYGPLPKSKVIYNGCERASRQPLAKEPFILAAGRLWDEAKNIRALETVAPHTRWPIYVAGDERNPDGGAVQAKGVSLLGVLDERAMSEWQARAAIYALPARYEPFGLSILEAAMAGCALVLGDIESLREIWQDAALYVAPDDEIALAAALNRLIDDPDLRADLSHRAMNRAARYSAAAMASEYLATYRQLMRQSAALQPPLAPVEQMPPSYLMQGWS